MWVLARKNTLKIAKRVVHSYIRNCQNIPSFRRLSRSSLAADTLTASIWELRWGLPRLSRRLRLRSLGSLPCRHRRATSRGRFRHRTEAHPRDTQAPPSWSWDGRYAALSAYHNCRPVEKKVILWFSWIGMNWNKYNNRWLLVQLTYLLLLRVKKCKM